MKAKQNHSSIKPLSFSDWMQLLFVDHGVVRLLYSNFYRVGEGVYRSSHPLPFHFRRLKRLQVKTILNLRGRGKEKPFYLVEKKACDKHGITLIDFPIKSNKLMTPDKIMEVKQMLESIEYPVLIHCKSGADRAGLICTLYNMFILNQSFPQANALKWYYGHLPFWSTGVLDRFFHDWMCFQEEEKKVDFESWIKEHYDIERIESTFYLNRFGEWFARNILRRE